MKTLVQSFRALFILTLLTGGLYPFAVWAFGQVFFRQAAEGSLLARDGHIVGSALLAQKNSDPRYFSPRSSAGDYATVASGASNLAWTSGKLGETANTTARQFRSDNHLSPSTPLPPDVTTASGSGLDPDLSPESARLQIMRISKVRGIDTEKILRLVNHSIQTSLYGPPRVNVLRLNIALDEMR